MVDWHCFDVFEFIVDRLQFAVFDLMVHWPCFDVFEFMVDWSWFAVFDLTVDWPCFDVLSSRLTDLVLMFLSDCEIPAWLFLIRWPSSHTIRSGPGLIRASCTPTNTH
jgi:hypothetical protein